jgi:hypothetical protein
MSQSKIKELIEQGQLICPECGKPITKFDKYVELMESIWEGAGTSGGTLTGSSKVTLICGNGQCSWQERTEYWENYIA